jgi:hypothetical protein
MAMLQSERLNYLLKEQTKYISRSKVRDSSELTFIRKAQASSTEVPQLVAGNKSVNGKSCNVTYKGNGTNKDYSAVLESAQYGAVYTDTLSSSPIQQNVITAPTYDRGKVPFAQQDLSGAFVQGVYTGPYTAPQCRVPGFVQYFPPIKFNGKYCKFNQNIYPS